MYKFFFFSKEEVTNIVVIKPNLRFVKLNGNIKYEIEGKYIIKY